MTEHHSSTAAGYLKGLACSGTGPSRRGFLFGGMLSAAGLLFGIGRPFAAPADPAIGGEFAGLVPFEDEQMESAGTLVGSELDGRLYTVLSRVSAQRRITPNAEFFVRTAASRLLPSSAEWKIVVDGLVEQPAEIGIAQLRKVAKPMGIHLLECAGNVALTRFGLMSVADWTGVPVNDVLGEARRKSGAAWVEISGFDEYSAPSHTSVPGASWIFPLDALKGAFLATWMNGQSLSPDHGAPTRLVIPGWYGAACIKWVNRLTLVDEDAQASSQMLEYAVRTLQEGRPRYAREYAPATVDGAALPVRVEKWAEGGKLKFRVVGIVWGGAQSTASLQIRFNPRETFSPVPGFHQTKVDPWTVWTYAWSPAAPGDYRIRMALDPAVKARKLELGLYDRTVHISEI